MYLLRCFLIFRYLGRCETIRIFLLGFFFSVPLLLFLNDDSHSDVMGFAFTSSVFFCSFVFLFAKRMRNQLCEFTSSFSLEIHWNEPIDVQRKWRISWLIHIMYAMCGQFVFRCYVLWMFFFSSLHSSFSCYLDI